MSENEIAILMGMFLEAKPEITEAQLKKMVLARIKEEDKKLGMKNSIDKKAALFLIAGEQNINLVSSSSQTLTELEKYLQGREEFKEFYRYAWEKLEIRINYLLDEIKKIDSSWYDGLNERDSYPALKSIIQTLFPEERLQDSNYPKDKKELEEWEIVILDEIPKGLKGFFNTLYLKFFKNNNIIPQQNSYFSYNFDFVKINAKIRYPDGVENPYIDQTNPTKDWTKNANISHEFMEYHHGILDYINSSRNFEIHKNDAASRLRFDKAGRKFSDPVSEIEHPSNYIMTSSLAIHAVYEFIELLQIWVDSNVINKKSA